MTSMCSPLALGVLGFLVACSGKDGGDDSNPGTDDSSSTDDTGAEPVWVDNSLDSAETFNGVVATGGLVWIAASGGAVEVWNGSAWTRYDETTTPGLVSGSGKDFQSVDGEDLVGIWGDATGAVVAVGNSGKVAKWTGSTWVIEDIGNATLNSVDGLAANNLMIGGWGGIFNNKTGDWGDPYAITGNPLMNHLWYDGSVGFAVGEDGARATFGGSQWAADADSELRTLYGVHALSLDDAWAVGEGGIAFHYNGESWEEFDTGTNVSLWAVWMVAKDSVYAVGNNGTALHYDGKTWTPIPTGASSNLYGLYAAGENDVWACGASGALYHYLGASTSKK